MRGLSLSLFFLPLEIRTAIRHFLVFVHVFHATRFVTTSISRPHTLAAQKKTSVSIRIHPWFSCLALRPFRDAFARHRDAAAGGPRIGHAGLGFPMDFRSRAHILYDRTGQIPEKTTKFGR